MVTLSQQAEFTEHPVVRDAIMAAVMRTAISISSEDEATSNHVNRVALAHRVITSPSQHIDSFVWAVSTNATVVAKWVSGDRDGALADIEFVLASVWDAVAGKEAPPSPHPAG